MQWRNRQIWGFQSSMLYAWLNQLVFCFHGNRSFTQLSLFCYESMLYSWSFVFLRSFIVHAGCVGMLSSVCFIRLAKICWDKPCQWPICGHSVFFGVMSVIAHAAQIICCSVSCVQQLSDALPCFVGSKLVGQWPSAESPD